MKETHNRLRIAEQKAQIALTKLRDEARYIYMVNAAANAARKQATAGEGAPFPTLQEMHGGAKRVNQVQQAVSAEIKMIRRDLRGKRFEAVYRGDLDPSQYRPRPIQKESAVPQVDIITVVAPIVEKAWTETSEAGNTPHQLPATGTLEFNPPADQKQLLPL